MAKRDPDHDQTISWGEPRPRGEPGTPSDRRASEGGAPAPEEWVPLSGELLELAREFVIARHASEESARGRLSYTACLWSAYLRKGARQEPSLSPADVAALNALAHLAAALGEEPSEVRYARAAAAVALAGELALEEGA